MCWLYPIGSMYGTFTYIYHKETNSSCRCIHSRKLTWQWKNQPWMKMYFLWNMVVFQPAMLVLYMKKQKPLIPALSLFHPWVFLVNSSRPVLQIDVVFVDRSTMSDGTSSRRLNIGGQTGCFPAALWRFSIGFSRWSRKWTFRKIYRWFVEVAML